MPIWCSSSSPLSDLDVAISIVFFLEDGVKVSILVFPHLENSYGSWIASEMVFIVFIFSFPFVYFFWMFIFVWYILGRYFCHLYCKCRLLWCRAWSKINVILSILNNKRSFLNILCRLLCILAFSLSYFSDWHIFFHCWLMLCVSICFCHNFFSRCYPNLETYFLGCPHIS